MGRTAGRSSHDTRKQILDAARCVVGAHGAAASVEQIAAQAAVSKGGLGYHFPSKESLLVALAREEFDDFRRLVHSHLDPTEPLPGRLTRAYVRASLMPIDGVEARQRFALLSQLVTVPAVFELVITDGQQWDEELGTDGVPAATQRLVLAAADGYGSALLWTATVDDADREQLAQDLFSLIAEATETAPER